MGSRGARGPRRALATGMLDRPRMLQAGGPRRNHPASHRHNHARLRWATAGEPSHRPQTTSSSRRPCRGRRRRDDGRRRSVRDSRSVFGTRDSPMGVRRPPVASRSSRPEAAAHAQAFRPSRCSSYPGRLSHRRVINSAAMAESRPHPSHALRRSVTLASSVHSAVVFDADWLKDIRRGVEGALAPLRPRPGATLRSQGLLQLTQGPSCS
jgi:hypothetical protein